METKKKLSVVILLILVIGALILYFSGRKNNPISSAPVIETVTENNLSSSTPDQIKPQTPQTNLPVVSSNSPKDIAWAVFQKYLEYNKSHNLAGVKSVVYKVSSVCDSVLPSDECKNRMDLAYSYGSALKKADFVNVWSDSKQIILTTDFKFQEDSGIIGRNRAIIFFIKDETDLKMLSFSPFKGATVDKSNASEQELHDRLIIYTEDKDQDGLADYQEECLGAKEGEICTKTDPKLRDTNDNGWWDGVEALMR
jgi:hypothetical protein